MTEDVEFGQEVHKAEKATTLTPERLLSDLGIPYAQRTNRLSLCCVFHHDKTPSASFYLDTQLYFCFGCEMVKTMVGFYAKYKELSKDRAEQELEKIYGMVPEQREIDRYSLTKERLKAEEVLKGKKDLGRKEHASLGELLDKIMFAYERGQLDSDRFFRALNNWYGRLDPKEEKACSSESESKSESRTESGNSTLPSTSERSSLLGTLDDLIE